MNTNQHQLSAAEQPPANESPMPQLPNEIIVEILQNFDPHVRALSDVEAFASTNRNNRNIVNADRKAIYKKILTELDVTQRLDCLKDFVNSGNRSTEQLDAVLELINPEILPNPAHRAEILPRVMCNPEKVPDYRNILMGLDEPMRSNCLDNFIQTSDRSTKIEIALELIDPTIQPNPWDRESTFFRVVHELPATGINLNTALQKITPEILPQESDRASALFELLQHPQTSLMNPDTVLEKFHELGAEVNSITGRKIKREIGYAQQIKEFSVTHPHTHQRILADRDNAIPYRINNLVVGGGLVSAVAIGLLRSDNNQETVGPLLVFHNQEHYGNQDKIAIYTVLTRRQAEVTELDDGKTLSEIFDEDLISRTQEEAPEKSARETINVKPNDWVDHRTYDFLQRESETYKSIVSACARDSAGARFKINDLISTGGEIPASVVGFCKGSEGQGAGERRLVFHHQETAAEGNKIEVYTVLTRRQAASVDIRNRGSLSTIFDANLAGRKSGTPKSKVTESVAVVADGESLNTAKMTIKRSASALFRK